MPPNIYAAATSAYGLPIVAKGDDGKLNHVEKGQPGAAFMPAPNLSEAPRRRLSRRQYLLRPRPD